MSNAEATILLRMVLMTITDSRMIPALGTPDLVDMFGFSTNDIRRIQDIAQDRHGATKMQAMKAAMLWVKEGRPDAI